MGQNVIICTFFMSIILFFWFKRWVLFQLSIKCSSIVCIQSKKSLIAWTFFVLEVDIGLMDPFLAWATHLRDSLVSNILISCTQIYIASITHDNIQPFFHFQTNFLNCNMHCFTSFEILRWCCCWHLQVTSSPFWCCNNFGKCIF